MEQGVDDMGRNVKSEEFVRAAAAAEEDQKALAWRKRSFSGTGHSSY